MVSTGGVSPERVSLLGGMDVGRAAECDTPSELLRKPGGIFADMVRALGSEAASAICDKANTKPEFVSFADEDGKGDCGPSCF